MSFRFKIGEVVRVRNIASPPMVVEAFYPRDPEMYYCSWFGDTKEKHCCLFDDRILEKVPTWSDLHE